MKETTMACFRMVFVALSSTLLLQANLSYAQAYMRHLCLGGNHTANSTFQANLNVLLSSITANTTANSYIFINKTVGEDADRVYAVFQCRGDYASDDCKIFAVTATEEIKPRCPSSKEAIVYYQECWLHYSNRSLSILQIEPTFRLWREGESGGASLFNQKSMKWMEELVVKAVSVSANAFAVGNTDALSSSQKIYGLVQCTQGLSKTDCSTCLTRAVTEFTIFKQKNNNTSQGIVLKPSCIAIFGDYQFYLAPLPAPAPPPPLAPLPAPAPPPPPPPTTSTPGQEKKSSRNVVIIVVPTVIVVLFISMIGVYIWLSRKKRFTYRGTLRRYEDSVQLNPVQSLQLDLSTVGAATGNFSLANKLGEGGFGAVYKGTLPDGREIAVKRLARNSVQGGEEFKNEVVLLSKLEHRNLVKLLGFCLEGDERLLIYEFLPNASLDHYLFEAEKVKSLDWETRYKIIRGIARGLLYLHEDSQLMIIHRDIKASNILLDEKMNPKISDFGMARLFMQDKTHGSTNRIVGTFGYMAPEYACYGNFSVKSDVFSFGVLVLEIISGQKNTRCFGSQCDEYLLGNAWKHLLEGTSLELLEPSLGEKYSPAEVIRCIHIGLLCVQNDVTKRPTMISVVVMLNRNTVTLPLPSAPAFFNDSTTVYDMVFEEHETEKTYSVETRLVDQSTASSTYRSENEM